MLREKITEALKAAMKAGDAARTSALRLILARLKETDINARGRGAKEAGEEEIIAMLRSMIKSRRESIALYREGNRPELAAKEEAEIAVIEEFLPPTLSGEALAEAVAAAIAKTGAQSARDMGRVMAALKAEYGSRVDMAEASALVRRHLAA